MNEQLIKRLLDGAYLVVDFLPRRVPEDSGGNFFEIEKFFLDPPYSAELRRKFLNIILKLNCYYDITAYDCLREHETASPSPQQLSDLIMAADGLVYIFISSEETLVSVDTDDTHMTVFSPTGRIRQLMEQLAHSEGLFVWKP